MEALLARMTRLEEGGEMGSLVLTTRDEQFPIQSQRCWEPPMGIHPNSTFGMEEESVGLLLGATECGLHARSSLRFTLQ